jgi:hypothetical protein
MPVSILKAPAAPCYQPLGAVVMKFNFLELNLHWAIGRLVV